MIHVLLSCDASLIYSCCVTKGLGLDIGIASFDLISGTVSYFALSVWNMFRLLIDSDVAIRR